MRIRALAVNLINIFTAVVEGILGLRFLLKLFGANDTGFVNWIYEMSQPLLAPFRGIFPSQVFENRYVLELTTLFAMLMYAILALLLVAVINAVSSAADSTDDEATETVVTKRRRR